MIDRYRRDHGEERGKNGAPNPAWTAAILLALEDGFRLHRLIDPETTPADSFLRAIGDLQRAIGVSSDAPSPSACRSLPATARTLPGEACQIASADRR